MRLALIIGNSQYLDKKLSYIPAPEADIIALSNVLNDANIGAFDHVEVVQNQPYSIVKRAITSFYTRKKPGDLILLYFSGHGVLDDDGRLYLALKDTEYDLLGGTALRATFITEQMNKSRSKSQVLILDCCNSGAVGRGTKGAPGIKMGTAATFHGTGSGRVILTATDAAQYAWNGDQVTGRPQTSLFTSYLIRGLQTGEADSDQDGEITLDEIYEYVYTKVIDKVKNQTPGKWAFGQRGEIIIAHNPTPGLAIPSKIPPELIYALKSSFPGLRAGAIRELDKITHNADKGTLEEAYKLLQKMVQDDSTTVSLAAAKLLTKLSPTPFALKAQSQRIQVANAHLVAEEKCWGIGTLNQLLLSPDKQAFMIASSLGLHFYGLEQLEELNRIDSRAWVRCAAFSPDGKTVAAGFSDGNLILYSTISGNPISIHKHHTHSVSCLIFLPGEDQLVAGYVDGRIIVLNLDSPEKPFLLEEHSGSVNCLAYSPAGDLLASASSDQSIILWDANRKTAPRKFYGHTAPVWTIDFSPDGQLIASGSSDENIIIWSTTSGKVISRLTGHLGKVNCLTFSNDSTMILSGGENGKLTLWNASLAEPLLTQQGHLLPVLSVCFYPGDRKFISASEDNSVIIWDTRSGSQEKTLAQHTSSLYCIDFSPSGSQLAIGSRDGSIQIWDIDTNKTIQTIFGHKGSVHNLAFTADSSSLFSVSRMDQITLWDIRSATRIFTCAGHSDRVVSMKVSGDRSTLVSGSLDGTVIQWDAQTKTPARVFNNFEGSLLDLSRDGTKLAFSAVHSAIHIYDIPTGSQISRIYAGSNEPRCAYFSLVDQDLILGNADGTISMYNIITGELKRSLSHHKSTVWDITFSNSGKLMASASHDRTIVLWDCSSWEPLQVLQGHTSRVLGVRFSPDDRALATCSWDGTVRLWGVKA